tara:strand:+ start:63 stop:287 length:225 start_codon:yes stop_codon:yes gene_type:complete
MDSNNRKETSTKSNCECCGFKRARNFKSNNKSSCIEKKPKSLTIKDDNAFLMKQIQELENELMELLEQSCECDM